MKKLLYTIKLEWLHLTFSIKYSSSTIDPEKWLIKYNDYLRKCQGLRNELINKN